MISRGSQIELWKQFNDINDNYFHELLDIAKLDYDFRKEWHHTANINNYYKDLFGLIEEINNREYNIIIIIEGELKFGDPNFIKTSNKMHKIMNPNKYTESYVIFQKEEIILEKLIKIYKMRSFV